MGDPPRKGATADPRDRAPAGTTAPQPTAGRGGAGRGRAGRSRGDSSRARVGAAPGGGTAGRERARREAEAEAWPINAGRAGLAAGRPGARGAGRAHG